MWFELPILRVYWIIKENGKRKVQKTWINRGEVYMRAVLMCVCALFQSIKVYQYLLIMIYFWPITPRNSLKSSLAQTLIPTPLPHHQPLSPRHVLQYQPLFSTCKKALLRTEHKPMYCLPICFAVCTTHCALGTVYSCLELKKTLRKISHTYAYTCRHLYCYYPKNYVQGAEPQYIQLHRWTNPLFSFIRSQRC